MSKQQFSFLLEAIGPKIEKSNTREDVIPPASRLLITLHYLATGDSFSSIARLYLIGVSTANQIIKETIEVIWDNFHQFYIVFPMDWEVESEKWTNLHRLPHCVGAVDGKHIRIQKPPHSGSLYFNYKKYFSIILLAVCDADANFIYVSIGAPGSLSDASVWNNTELGLELAAGNIDFPEPKLLPNSEIIFNYFFIGDEAFPLSKNLLRNYSGRNLSQDKEYFNKRLSSARNTIERSFGILSSRFRIFRREISVGPEFATSIVKCCVVLHNFIRKTADKETPLFEYNSSDVSFGDQQGSRGRSLTEATINRDIYKDYLLRN